ncbi:MAG TPA: glycosyltransferase family 4 protein [Chloroflexota bacterium]|nr:glycosyltransferase family 4 protein [Chloroflexota bacterium]
MRILIVLTYYRPHISGLTLYAQRLAEGLSRRGHHVTVLASQHAPDLPGEEMIAGVRVVRVPVAFRVGKGPVMPAFPWYLARLARESDIVSIHLPQLESGIAAGVARVAGRPAVLTYHCDLQLPPGAANRAIDTVVFGMNWAAGRAANRIVAYTHDYARHSRLLSRFPDKIEVIPPPVIPPAESDTSGELRRSLGLEERLVVGSACRVATEKGLEYLLDSLPLITSDRPVHLLHAGESRNVPGEGDYLRRLQPLIERYADRVTFLGQLPPEAMHDFFSSLDVLVVSSVNPTESFGLVQVEAMMAGTPVVATDLPGVREPVRMTGMGEVVPVRDAVALAAGISQVAANPNRYIHPRDEIVSQFDLNRTLDAYERLFHAQVA